MGLWFEEQLEMGVSPMKTHCPLRDGDMSMLSHMDMKGTRVLYVTV